MNEMFAKGFGLVFGVYAGFVVTAVVDDALPDKYKQYKRNKTESDNSKEEEEAQ